MIIVIGVDHVSSLVSTSKTEHRKTTMLFCRDMYAANCKNRKNKS